MTDHGAAHSAASQGSEAGPGATSSPPSAREPAVLWAESLQALANLVAHDLRNALNAVAVNLEVVRGRSARGADVSAIAPFAATAATNFETAAAATEALLALARPELARVDVAVLAARVERLLAVGGQARLRLTDYSGGRATTDIPGDIVRAAVARSVLAAIGTSETAACEITVDDGILVRVTGATGVAPVPDSELVAAALAYDIRFAVRERSLELRMPAVDQRATLHVSS